MSLTTWAAIIAGSIIVIVGLVFAVIMALPQASAFELEQAAKQQATQSTGLLGNLFAPSWGLVAESL
jgi:hypothetical protein